MSFLSNGAKGLHSWFRRPLTQIGCKGSAKRAKYQRKILFSLYFRVAAYLRQSQSTIKRVKNQILFGFFRAWAVIQYWTFSWVRRRMPTVIFTFPIKATSYSMIIILAKVSNISETSKRFDLSFLTKGTVSIVTLCNNANKFRMKIFFTKATQKRPKTVSWSLG